MSRMTAARPRCNAASQLCLSACVRTLSRAVCVTTDSLAAFSNRFCTGLPAAALPLGPSLLMLIDYAQLWTLDDGRANCEQKAKQKLAQASQSFLLWVYLEVWVAPSQTDKIGRRQLLQAPIRSPREFCWTCQKNQKSTKDWSTKSLKVWKQILICLNSSQIDSNPLIILIAFYCLVILLYHTYMIYDLKPVELEPSWTILIESGPLEFWWAEICLSCMNQSHESCSCRSHA